MLNSTMFRHIKNLHDRGVRFSCTPPKHSDPHDPTIKRSYVHDFFWLKNHQELLILQANLNHQLVESPKWVGWFNPHKRNAMIDWLIEGLKNYLMYWYVLGMVIHSREPINQHNQWDGIGVCLTTRGSRDLQIATIEPGQATLDPSIFSGFGDTNSPARPCLMFWRGKWTIDRMNYPLVN